MARCLPLLFLLSLAPYAAAENLRTFRGTCEIAPPVPTGYELSSIDAGSSDVVIPQYDPKATFPRNSCPFYGGILRAGRCVQSEDFCDYKFKETAADQGPLVVQVVHIPCDRSPIAPGGFALVSDTIFVRTVVAELYQVAADFPMNSCQGMLGPRAYVKDGVCSRDDKVCTYGYQRATAK